MSQMKVLEFLELFSRVVVVEGGWAAGVCVQVVASLRAARRHGQARLMSNLRVCQQRQHAHPESTPRAYGRADAHNGVFTLLPELVKVDLPGCPFEARG